MRVFGGGVVHPENPEIPGGKNEALFRVSDCWPERIGIRRETVVWDPATRQESIMTMVS
jgi:hypothetical protein